MAIQLVDPNLCDPNPNQPPTRTTFSPDQLADLESIKTIKFLHTPLGRPHPSQPGRFQLALGWRRRCAWLLFRPGEPMPLDVQSLTDEQMFDYGAIENGQRTDLTAIEKAHLLESKIKRFGASQADAGKLLGIGQPAVSNLLRLLKLPEPVQVLVGQGDLPERIARQLVPVAQIAPDKVGAVAQAIAHADSADKDNVADQELHKTLNKSAIHLVADMWPLDWKPADRPACTGCPLHITVSYMEYCGDKGCFDAKTTLWMDHELKRLSAKTGIPIAQPSEKAQVLNIDYSNDSKVAGWLKSKSKLPASLRLVPNTGKLDDYHLSRHKSLLGSSVVLLAGLDKSILDKKADEIKKDNATVETDAQRTKREALEEREREKRREEKATLRRAHADITWLVLHTAQWCGDQLSISGAILVQALDVFHRIYSPPVSSDWPEIRAALDALDAMGRHVNAPKPDTLLRRKLVITILSHVIGSWDREGTNWKRSVEVVEQNCSAFGITLATGWNKPPVHHSKSNCWVCGIFTSMDHVTQRDQANGWQIAKDGAVTCSDKCRAVGAHGVRPPSDSQAPRPGAAPGRIARNVQRAQTRHPKSKSKRGTK